MKPVSIPLISVVTLLAAVRCSGAGLFATCLNTHTETLYHDFTTAGCGWDCDAGFCACLGAEYVTADASCTIGASPTCPTMQNCLRNRIVCLNQYARTNGASTLAPPTPAPPVTPAPPATPTPAVTPAPTEGPASGQCKLNSNSLKVGLAAIADGLSYTGSAVDGACKNILCNDYLGGLTTVYATCKLSAFDVSEVCKDDPQVTPPSATRTLTFTPTAAATRSSSIAAPATSSMSLTATPPVTHSKGTSTASPLETLTTSRATPTLTATPAHTVTASHGPSPSQTPIATRTATLPLTATPSHVGSGSIPHSTTHTTAATHTGTATTTRSVALPTTPTASLPHSRSATPSQTRTGTWTATQPPTATPTGAGTSSGAATPSSTRPASTTVTTTPSTTQAPTATHSLPATPTMTTAGTQTTTLRLSVSATRPGGTASRTRSNTANHPLAALSRTKTPRLTLHSATFAPTVTAATSLTSSWPIPTRSHSWLHAVGTVDPSPAPTAIAHPQVSSPTRSLSPLYTTPMLQTSPVPMTEPATLTAAERPSLTTTITLPSATPPLSPPAADVGQPTPAKGAEPTSGMQTVVPSPPTPIPPTNLTPPPPVSSSATAQSVSESESESDSQTDLVPELHATRTASVGPIVVAPPRLGNGAGGSLREAQESSSDDNVAPVAAGVSGALLFLILLVAIIAIIHSCFERRNKMKRANEALGSEYRVDSPTVSVEADGTRLDIDACSTASGRSPVTPWLSPKLNVQRPPFWVDNICPSEVSRMSSPLQSLEQSGRSNQELSESHASPHMPSGPTYWEDTVRSFCNPPQSFRQARRAPASPAKLSDSGRHPWEAPQY